MGDRLWYAFKKCNEGPTDGGMVLGFVYTSGDVKVPKWYDGDAEGAFLMEIKHSTGTGFRISAVRCASCCFLELYVEKLLGIS